MDIQAGDVYQTKRKDRKLAPIAVLARVDNWLMMQKQPAPTGEGHPFVYSVDDFIEIFVQNCEYSKIN